MVQARLAKGRPKLAQAPHPVTCFQLVGGRSQRPKKDLGARNPLERSHSAAHLPPAPAVGKGCQAIEGVLEGTWPVP